MPFRLLQRGYFREWADRN